VARSPRPNPAERFLQRRIKTGALSIKLGSAPFQTYGDGTGAEVRAVLDRGALLRILARPTSLTIGECYMDGSLRIERGEIFDLVALVARNSKFGAIRVGWLQRILRSIRQRNDELTARRNAAHHYDLSQALYRRFLDEDMQYSCAYWARPDMTLEEAQAAKRTHIASKLRIEPGMKVLDIGCGWGGLGLDLAGNHGAEVLGVTLSQEQLSLAKERAKAAGLGDRCRFSLTDFRDVTGPFDRIVSVGMFEHVGAPHFQRFFLDVRRLLTDDGVALLHSIGRSTPPSLTNGFIRKYIFPGGYIPALSETIAAVEQAGLWITDIEILRVHYGETLKAWRERFAEQRAAIAELYDERFCRMWEFYLACSELAFRYGDHMNFQMQLAKHVYALPMTRDYMVDAEREGPAASKARSAA
jgi:cyclopropane-fatty-acyl-phospholipid synthase